LTYQHPKFKIKQLEVTIYVSHHMTYVSQVYIHIVWLALWMTTSTAKNRIQWSIHTHTMNNPYSSFQVTVCMPVRVIQYSL